MTAGYEEETVLGLDRANLMNMFAELLAAGKITLVGAAAPHVLAYDPELEKQKLIFEERKWEVEMEMKEKQLQLEEEQLAVHRLELAQEKERKDSSAVKGKLFGDAMRASAIHMRPDVLDAIPFSKKLKPFSKFMGFLKNCSRCSYARFSMIKPKG